MANRPLPSTPRFIRSTLLMLAASLMLGGCALIDGNTDDNRRLGVDRERAAWQANAPDQYAYVYVYGCFCPEEVRGPFEVVVQDGVVVSAVREGGPVTDFSPIVTVDELFDLIEEAYAEGADQVEVIYHEPFGYPLEISIDYDTGVADDELFIAVTSFRGIR